MAKLSDERYITGPVPPGTVFPYAGATAPSGYLFCTGSAISRTVYPALFAALSSSHGSGDGTTTFNLPDYRGRFLRGIAGGSTNDPDRASRTAPAAGGNTGDNVGSVQAQTFGSHQHTVQIGDSPTGANGYGGVNNTGANTNWTFGSAAAQTGAATFSNFVPSAINSGQAAVVGGVTYSPMARATGGSETRPVNAYVNYIIKI